MSPHNERGSVSIWLVTASFVMIVLVGLAVDLTGQVHAQQRARDTAAQAARAGGQEIQEAQAIRGDGAYANPLQAQSAAQNYLKSAGVQGTVSVVQGGTTLRVTTKDTYKSKFLSIIGLNSMTVSGEAEARIVQAIEGNEQ